MLQFLNYFFFIFHTLFTIFNMVGWAFPATRKLHLYTMSLTAFCWIILGIWYGFGYCPCTDWHWEVRQELGYVEKFDSYIQFLLYKLTGVELDATLVETVTGVIFLACFILTIFLNTKDRRMKELDSWRDVHGKPLKRKT